MGDVATLQQQIISESEELFDGLMVLVSGDGSGYMGPVMFLSSLFDPAPQLGLHTQDRRHHHPLSDWQKDKSFSTNLFLGVD